MTETNQPTPPLPSPDQKPRLSDYQIEERSTEARVILNNPVFQLAVQDVYSRAFQTLLNAEVGSLTASAAHASMKAVRDVQKQLDSYVTDKKMREKFTRSEK